MHHIGQRQKAAKALHNLVKLSYQNDPAGLTTYD
jgi:hypothetical protein